MKKIITLFLLLTLTLAMFACNSNDLENSAFSELKLEDNTRQEMTDVRIMSFNALVHMKSWGGTPVKPRAQMFSEVLKHYLPDVIGLQEFCGCWKRQLPKRISESYEMIEIKNKKAVFYNNRTPMAYNKNTLRLISSDMYPYSKKDNSKCRIVTFAEFEVISTGEHFAVTNTHWDFGMEEQKVEYRKTQIKELAETIESLASKGIPVFAVGDYNVYEKDIENSSESYYEFINSAKVTDAKFEEGVIQKPFPDIDYNEESWDHIFYRGNATILSFTILANDFYDKMSDHYPIFSDIQLY